MRRYAKWERVEREARSARIMGVSASATKRCAWLTLASIALALAGCGAPRSFADASMTAGQPGASAYPLMPGDKIQVNVFNEPDFSGEFQVNGSGKVAFPLIGDVPAAGATPAEFQRRLTARLSAGVVRNPKVTVDVSNYRPVNVLGEVRNAGQYPFRAGLSAQDAIALAGGYTYRANTHTVYVRRAGANGEISARTDGPSISIHPGDTLRVPQRYF
jgi:polysaccharide export outer membrane protein